MQNQQGCRQARALRTLGVGWALSLCLTALGSEGVQAGPAARPPSVTAESMRHYTFRMVGPYESRKLVYEQGSFGCAVRFLDTSFVVTLQNKAAKVMRIDWNRARYTDPEGRTHALACAGKATIDEAQRKSQTLVEPGHSQEVRVLPLDGLYARQTTVYENPLLPLLPEEARGLRGRLLRLYLPIETEGRTVVHRLDVKVGFIERNVYCGALFGALPPGSTMPPGALVRKVIEHSPAAVCGLKDDDVVTQADERPIEALKPWWDFLAGCTPGQRVRLRVQRGARTLDLTLELAAPQEY